MPSEPDPRPTPPPPRPLQGWLLARFVGACVSGLLFLFGSVAWLYYPLPLEEHVGPLGALAVSAGVSFLVGMPFCAWVFYVCMEGRPPSWRSVAGAYLDALGEGVLRCMELPAQLLVLLVRAIRPLGLVLHTWLRSLLR